MINLKNEKKLLRQHGKVIDYSEFQEDEIKEQYIQGLKYRLMYLIKEAEIKKFTTSINNKYGIIHLTDSKIYSTSEINFKKKDKNYLEVGLCVKEHHFIPDKISKDDILFFFNLKHEQKLFITVKDEYINEILYSEHSIFGLVDFCKGSDLLSERDSSIKPKMKTFYKEINNLAKKYADILFVTISDSIIIKHSFKVLDKKGNLSSENFNFNRIIKLFKEIREITRKTLKMKTYGVFSYGRNKSETVISDSSNLFHTGILSPAFKKVFEIEEICRKLKKDKQADLYMDNMLYHSFRHYVQENWREGREYPIEQSVAEWGISKEDIDITKKNIGISEEDITVLKIPDKSLIFSEM